MQMIAQLAKHISDVQLENRMLKEQLKEFKNGEKYLKIKAKHKKELAAKDRIISELKKEIAAAHEETREVRNMWMQANEDVIKEKNKAIAEAGKKIKKAEEKMYEAQRQRDEAKDKLKEKCKELYEVKTKFEEKEGIIQKLTGQIKKDYTNSSNPSSMSPNHKKIPNSREKSGLNPGGQPGHEHHGRKTGKITRTIKLPTPEKFLDSTRYKPTGKEIHKQLVKVHFCVERIDYVAVEYRDMLTGARVNAEFPEGIKDDVNYDGTVKAFAYLINNDCNVSINKTRTFIENISHGELCLSDGLICKLAKQFSDKTEKERDEIFKSLVADSIMHADFTFGRVNGKQGTVMVCCQGDKVLYQGKTAKGDVGVTGSPLEVFQGILISDHEAALIKKGSAHQECLAHPERYLIESVSMEKNLTWNAKMIEWIKKSVHYWNQVHNGAEVYDEAKVEALHAEFDKIVELGKEEYEYEPPSDYYKAGFNLHKRLYEDREQYTLFLKDTRVEPTNNLAERYGRKFKRKAKQVMAFRSQNGLEYFCNGLSILQSLYSAGNNVYDAVAERFGTYTGE